MVVQDDEAIDFNNSIKAGQKLKGQPSKSVNTRRN